MWLPLLLLTTSALFSHVTGAAQRCQACKTAGALERFGNLFCDEMPPSAPDCTILQRDSRQHFHMDCPADSKCLTITSEGEELRMCTRKPNVGTMKTTDGVVMTVCDTTLCNGNHAGLPLASPLLLLLATLAAVTML